jgi:hypothetical protein
MLSAIITCFLVVGLLSANTGLAAAESTAVVFDKASHFTAADDADVLVAAGIYHIERSTGTRLRLVGTLPETTVEIQATMTMHEEVVASPLALVIAEEGQEDVVHLVLLFPDGQGLDAAGTFSGTRSRGSRVQPINRPQMQQAMSQIQPFSQPPSASPLLRVSPAATAATATPPAESVDTSNPGNSVTWNYLAMHHPGIVAQALADVQTGKQPRSSVAGLASDVELNDMLKTNWTAEVSALRQASITQAGVTPRGLSLTDQVTAIPEKSPFPPVLKVLPPTSNQVTTIPFGETTLPSTYQLIDLTLPPRNLGSVWAGRSAFAYVFITAPVDGHVEGRFNLNATNRHFRIVNATAYTGEVVNGTPAVSLTIPGGQYQDVVLDPANPPTQISRAGFVAILAKKGQLIAFTVAFEPVGLGMTPVGDNEATLQLSGATTSEINILSNAPGTTWRRTASIRGRFEGINFGVLGAIDNAAITVFYDGTPCGRLIPVPASITFHNAEQQVRSVSVTAELSHPLHMQAFTVSVAPGERKQVPIPIQIDSCPNQGVEYMGRLSYAYADVVRRAEFGVTLYPKLLHWYKDSADVGSCRYSWDIYAQPDGTTRFAWSLRNLNLIYEKQLDLRFSVLGQQIGSGTLQDGQNTVNTKYRDYTSSTSFVRDNYVRLFSAPAQVGLRCHNPGS